MDANITIMMAVKKVRSKISSYFFSDPVLGWAAHENSKKRFKSDYDLWTLQSTHKWANKVINNNKIKIKGSQSILQMTFSFRFIEKIYLFIFKSTII